MSRGVNFSVLIVIMPKDIRQQEILDLLKADRKKVVSVKQICQKCYISESSARRDLKQLEEEGLIKRFHGGAKLVEYETPAPFVEENNEEKTQRYQLIAEEAARFIENNNTIFLDSDPLTNFLIPLLASFNQLTVITNGFNNIHSLMKIPKVSSVFVGGIVSNTIISTIGSFAVEFIDNFYVDLAFISCHAFDTIVGASEISEEHMMIKKKYISQAKKTILLCDSTKIGKSFPYVICKPNVPDFLITDSQLSPKEADKLIQARLSFRCV